MSAESSRLVSRTTSTTSLGDRLRDRRLDLLRRILGVALLDLLDAHAKNIAVVAVDPVVTTARLDLHVPFFAVDAVDPVVTTPLGVYGVNSVNSVFVSSRATLALADQDKKESTVLFVQCL